MEFLNLYKQNGIIFNFEITDSICWLSFNSPFFHDIPIFGSTKSDAIDLALQYIKKRS